MPSVRPTNVRAGQSFPAIPELLPNSPGALTLEPCVFQRKNRWREKFSVLANIFAHTGVSVFFGRWACLLVSGVGVGECRRRWWWWGWSQHPRQAAPGPPPATQCPAISADYHPTHRQHCSSSTASSSTCTMSWLLFRDP